MFMQTFANRQWAQLMPPQIEAVKMADGQLGSFVPGIVGGRFVPVSVQGETFIAGQFRNSGQSVKPGGALNQRQVNSTKQIAPPLTAQGVEIRPQLGRGVQSRPVLLKKTTPALNRLKHARQAEAKPLRVGKARTIPRVRTRFDKAGERLKKRFVHGDRIWIQSHEKTFFLRLFVNAVYRRFLWIHEAFLLAEPFRNPGNASARKSLSRSHAQTTRANIPSHPAHRCLSGLISF